MSEQTGTRCECMRKNHKSRARHIVPLREIVITAEIHCKKRRKLGVLRKLNAEEKP